jgi:hypothetical protein
MNCCRVLFQLNIFNDFYSPSRFGKFPIVSGIEPVRDKDDHSNLVTFPSIVQRTPGIAES